MKLITKALCLPDGSSTIPVLILAIKRSAQYRIQQSLLIQLLIFNIWLQRNSNWSEVGIIGCLGVTIIGGYPIEIDVLIGVFGTDMDVGFGFGGGPTTVNRMAVTALHRIVTH